MSAMRLYQKARPLFERDSVFSVFHFYSRHNMCLVKWTPGWLLENIHQHCDNLHQLDFSIGQCFHAGQKSSQLLRLCGKVSNQIRRNSCQAKLAIKLSFDPKLSDLRFCRNQNSSTSQQGTHNWSGSIHDNAENSQLQPGDKFNNLCAYF